MRKRPSSRLLVVDPAGRVLLFRFVHMSGPLAGQDFWATPGGALEANESFEVARPRPCGPPTWRPCSVPSASVRAADAPPDPELLGAGIDFGYIRWASRTMTDERATTAFEPA